jgi:hypothetical protein
LCDGFLSLDAGLRHCVTVLKQHFAHALVRLNMLEMIPHFFNVLIYTFESIVFPLCITLRRITPLQSQNIMTITFPADAEQQGAVLYLLLHPSFCPVTYIAPVDCSISINIVELLIEVAYCFFHCNKKLYHSTL